MVERWPSPCEWYRQNLLSEGGARSFTLRVSRSTPTCFNT